MRDRRIRPTARPSPLATRDGAVTWYGIQRLVAAIPTGHDELGRDVLSRVLDGGRTSLLIGVDSVMGGLMVGEVAGVRAGYRGLGPRRSH